MIQPAPAIVPAREDGTRKPRGVRVSVIVVNYRTASLLPGCLDAYLAQDHRDLDLLVMDNASGDGSLEILERYVARQPDNRRSPTIRFVANRDNRGFCGAINDALAMTDAPVVVFSNVDVRPAPDLISVALEALLADDRRGTIQPKLLRDDLAETASKTYDAAEIRDRIDTTGHVIDRARLVANRAESELDDGAHDTAGEVFGASGALVMHRRAMLDDVAWRGSARGEVLTEDLFAFFDDVELDWRARRFDWKAWYEPRAVARHQRGGAGARRTWRVEALNFSNRLLVVATCDDRRRLFAAAPVFVATTALKAAELFVTSPRGFVVALARLVRGMPGALRRRRELQRRCRLDAAEVIDRWCVPFAAKRWVTTWWYRTRPRRDRSKATR